MSNLFLGDVYNEIFKPNFAINEDVVVATYNEPDFTQELKIGVKLLLKRVSNNNTKSYLLLCIQKRNNAYFFAFSYWIPEALVSSSIELLDILSKFINIFGMTIRVGCIEDRFILETTVSLDSTLRHPEQVINILGSPHIPCEYYFFDNNQFIVSESLVFVDVYYAFAINNNKYLAWLNEIPKVQIKIPKEWENYLSNLIDVLEPNGTTQLKILKPRRSEVSQENSEIKDLTEVSVPEKYKHQFKHIENLLISLHPDEKLVIIPSLTSPFCLFCGSKEISKEHIFPKWIKPYFQESIFNTTLHIRADINEDLLDSLKSGVEGHKESSYGYTTQQVCKRCNETWMSKLENDAKSIMVTNDEKLVEQLNDENEENKAFTLSKWLFKIAILLANKALNSQIFSLDTYKSFKDGYIPNGIIVEMTNAESYELGFLVNSGANGLIPIKVRDTPADEAIELASSFFMVSLQIGRLLFRVSYLPTDSPLQRGICLKKTDVLYPWKANLSFHVIEVDEQFWSESILNGLELHIFNSGMVLVDYKV
jgi:hypothetical protein